MRFTNLTRGNEIGANCYLVEFNKARIVLDCGMHPRKEGEDATPLLRNLPEDPVDAIFVSHAHLDHIGCLPLAMRRQPGAPVYMSEASLPLVEILLHNSVNVMSKQREALDIRAYPLFTHREAETAATGWTGVPLHQRISVEGERLSAGEEPGALAFQFFDAGHIMGSTGILFEADGRKVFYTGDVNFDDQTLSKGASFPEEHIDVLIIETTRGDSPMPPGFSRKQEAVRLGQAIRETFERGGAVLIPVFALGKTQELLAMIHFFKRDGLLGETPLYIGGLSTKITEVYDKYAGRVPRHHERLQLLDTLAPYVVNGKNADQTPVKPGRIYALSSGMMTEKTLSNAFANTFFTNPKHSVFFIGYADPESPAGRVKVAKRGDYVQVDQESPPVALNCEIQNFNFSAHASRESLLEYIRKVNPTKVILVHGDTPAIAWFQQELATAAPQIETIVPRPGETIEV